MSRCFPFPPPGFGYQTHIKPDHPASLIKEQNREKNHKKEKKESKDKCEKERIYEKHRDKKDKKEKHRDKKERGLDNDKHKGIGIFSDEKRPVGPPNADLHKLREKSKNKKNDGSLTLVDERVAGTGAIPVLVGKEKPNEKTADVKKIGALLIVGENMFCGHALAQNVIRPVNLADKSPRPMAEGKERKEKQAVVGMVQNRVGSMVTPVEKKLEPKAEEKGQPRETQKEDVGEKPIHKVKDTDMVTKKEENLKATSEQKRHAQIPSKRDGMCTPSAKNDWKKDFPAPLSYGIQNLLNTSNEGSATLLGKRKDIGLGGMYDEQMTEPNKLARTASTHPLTETEPCQNSATFSARPPINIKVERTFAPDGTQGPPANIKVEGSARKLNDTKMSPITQSSQITSKSTRKSDISAKPLHPDTKYLTQVLTVPKLDEWPVFEDQEWLFRGNNSQTRKLKVETSWFAEEPKVWASAVWLDQVHVFALPYVIPH